MIRVVFIGSSSVGKTSIVHRLKTGTFLDDANPTIGAGATTVSHSEISFQLWDTAGQERFRNLVPMYYKSAQIAVLVFSWTDKSSFTSLDYWIEELKNSADKNISIIVVGNKADNEVYMISDDKVALWCKEKGITMFYTSAKTGRGIGDLLNEFVRIGEKVKDKLTKDPINGEEITESYRCC